MPTYDPYPSLNALRNKHRGLLQKRRKDGITPEFIEEVTAFIYRGKATGVLLASESDRFDAQNVLDFWENELHHVQRDAPEPTLADYDPSLAPELDDSLSPYIGLEAFDAQNKSLFYGRERIVNDMIKRLEHGRFLAISGASGSGKSSIAQAGLLPKLQNGNLPESETWHYFPRCIPGYNPLTNLAQAIKPDQAPSTWVEAAVEKLRTSNTALAELVKEQIGDKTAVLYIDQFEEIFTLDPDPKVRHSYIDNLLYTIQDDSQNRLILTMRGDFESRLAHFSDFQAVYTQAQYHVSAMTAVELHEVILKPAEVVGLQFDDGIPDQLVRDVLGEPSALPLLQFALLTLWENRDKNRITWEAYNDVGGAQQALAQSANRLFDSIGPKAQDALKHIFLHLIRPLPGLAVTKQPAFRSSLYTPPHTPEVIDSVIEELQQAKLIHVTNGITPTEDRIEVTHEALVRSWPRLNGWLEEARVAQRKRLRLTSQAQQWQALHRDESALLRGLVLQEALQYDDLSNLEADFVQASQDEANREEQEKNAARQAELKITRRNNRRLLILSILLMFSFGAAMIFLAFARLGLTAAQESAQEAELNAREAQYAQETAVSAQSTAEWNAAVAATAEAEAETQREAAFVDRNTAEQSAQLAEAARQDAVGAQAEAEANARQALARELSSQAINQLVSDPTLALLLAVEGAYIPLSAHEFVPLEITDALYRALEASQLQLTLPGHTDRIAAVFIAPPTDDTPSRIFTSSLDGSTKVWNSETGQEITTLNSHTAGITDAAMNVEQGLFATGGQDGRIYLYDLNSLNNLATYSSENQDPVHAISLSQDGSKLAAAFASPPGIIWDLTGNDPPQYLFDLPTNINDIAFTANDTHLTLADGNGTLSVIAVQDGTPLDGIIHTNSTGEVIPLHNIAYSSDESLLAVILQNNNINIYQNSSDGLKLLNIIPGQTRYTSMAFHPQNNNLVTGGGDNTAKVWDVITGELIYTLSGHNGEVSAVAYSQDGEQIVTGSQDSIGRLWRTGTGIEPITLSGHNASVNSLAYNNEGTQLATGGADNIAFIWNPENGNILQTFIRHDGAVNDLVFSPDDTHLVTASNDQIVRFFDVQTAEITAVLRHDSAVKTLAFSPDGSILATGDDTNTIHLWDVASQEEVHVVDVGATIRDIAYHPTDSVLTVATNTAVSLWDVNTLEKTLDIPLPTGPINQIAFSHDGHTIAAASNDGTAKLWHYPSGNEMHTLIGHNGAVLAVAFNPDDTLLATGGANRTARIWALDTGANVRIVRGHTGNVTAVSFNPDPADPHLATASSDRTVQITPLTQIRDLFNQAWALLERPLTTAECLQYHHTESCLTNNIDQPSPIASD